ncbi:helix-turn-helix transcriptional regulator [Pseudophaeobacter flagellatus]|uniref:helix-turn-helix transcriptional regulator n=1 Tax=Pseudophaeobacter flagellatus TaxID=2899119 RepID=UPI001E53E031|nr:helix-turn-helix transcriptional regulator [Pseudophaeobacter flagellatus]MCD9149755.1 helix-turn-helix transcriptional regulator [Pseudophaeobacter flagellatus]
MSFLPLAQWLTLLGDKSHNIIFLNEDGNAVSFSEADAEEPLWQVILNWRNIHIGDPLQKAKLSRLVQASLEFGEQRDTPLPSPVKLESESGRVAYIDAVPVPIQLREKLNGAHSLLYIREVEHTSDYFIEFLQQEYHLTPAEASVTTRLASGSSLTAASKQLNISIWTARSHLRSIFQKTNTHRQAELVALLAHADY